MNQRKLMRMLAVFGLMCALLPVWAVPALAVNGTLAQDADGAYLIDDAADLAAFAAAVNGGNSYAGETVKLTADIALNENVLNADGTLNGDGSGLTAWTPIGIYVYNAGSPFSGTFDGQGHTISGLYFNDTTKNYVGLFAYINNAGITNLGVSGWLNGKEYIGGICARSKNSTITDCHSACTLGGSGTFADIGGIAGYCENTVIERCYNEGVIKTTKGRIGGICGAAWESVTINDCYNTAPIDGGKANYVSGIVGYNNGTKVTCCYNTGNISGGTRVGGIVGENAKQGAQVINVYNTGNITSTMISTVVAGQKGSFVGGIYGGNLGGQFHNCYNTGNISHLEDEYGTFGGIGGNGGPCYHTFYLSNNAVNTGMGGVANLLGDNAAVPKDVDAFAFGEIAWALYNNFDQYHITAADVQVWGQTLSGADADPLPVLTTDAAKRVYKVTFKTAADAEDTDYAVRYANSGQTVTLPEEPAMEEGYVFGKWAISEDAAAFTETTPVTADITLVAYGADPNADVTLAPGESVSKGDTTVTNNDDGTVTVANGDTATTITLPAGADDVVVDKDGSVTVPAGSKLQTDDAQTTIDAGSGKVDKDGNITFPEGGKVTVEKGGKTTTVDVKVGETFKPCDFKPSTSHSSGGSSSSRSFVVTFHADNGEKNTTVTVTGNTALEEPKAPAKEGYTFDGWYTDSKLTEKYDFSAKVTKSFTLYAKWTAAEDKPQDLPDDTPFTDVKESDWFCAPVLQAFKDGLMLGVTDTKFAPNDNITRGMFVTVLYRMEGEPQTAADNTFVDVAASQYYAKAVAWANANGIVEGTSAARFEPQSSITREQMAAMIYRYAKFKGQDTAAPGTLDYYSDSAAVSDYAKDAVIWSSAAGILNGNADGTFAAQANATRAEAAAVFTRLAEKF